MFRIFQYSPTFSLHADNMLHVLDNLHLGRLHELPELGSVALAGLVPPLIVLLQQLSLGGVHVHLLNVLTEPLTRKIRLGNSLCKGNLIGV